MGFGTDTVDPRDSAMQDAADLCATDHQGNALWHPATLADLRAVPARAWLLWEAMQAGLAARAQPFAWWRVKGVPTAHRFEASPIGAHDVARCGWTGPADATWIRTDDPPRCRGCEGMAESDNRPGVGWGRIGDVVLGQDGRPLEVTP